MSQQHWDIAAALWEYSLLSVAHLYTGVVIGSESELLYDWRFTANEFVLIHQRIKSGELPFCYEVCNKSFCHKSTFAVLSLCNILSDETCLLYAIAAGPRQRSHFRVRVQRESLPYFTVRDSRRPNLEGQVPVLIYLRNREVQACS
jgi:hypothetical protein